MFYRPIESQQEFETRVRLSDLHGSGTPEDQHIDFKVKEPMKKQREFARDIAQFANGDGGSLIIGVDAPQDPTTNRDTAKAIVAVPSEGRLQAWIEQALSNYLHPAISRPRSLFFKPWGSGLVAVINVDPVPDLVAVSRYSEPKDGIEHLYRTTTGKVWFTPDEVTMRVQDSRSRAARLRMKTILHRINPNSPIPAQVKLLPALSVEHRQGLQSYGFDESSARNRKVAITKLEETEFALTVDDPQNIKAQQTLQVPYDFVNSIWLVERYVVGLDLKYRILLSAEGHLGFHRS